MGFTVVDVNMRGTGCSGGAFDFFEPLQSLDGYDVIETIARQPWVAHHKVGMMGISYGGISQLFTAQLQPAEPRRDLAAVGDRRDADDAVSRRHPQHRLRGRLGQGARPRRPAGLGETAGSRGRYKRIQEGDATCKANQALHGEAVDLLAKVRANNHYVPKVADPLAPVTFVNKINVPTYMACQWTDEQTGGHCPTLAEHFSGTSRKWFTFTNGTHVDSLDPETFNRWFDFLELYVAREAPSTKLGDDPGGRAGDLPGGDGDRRRRRCRATRSRSSPPTRARWPRSSSCRRSASCSTTAPAARRPAIRCPASSSRSSRFPVPGTRAREVVPRASGGLGKKPQAKRGADVFRWNPHARPLTDFSGDTAAGENGLWTATPPYRWAQNPAGTAASYVTAPLRATTTVIGAGAVHAWIRSSTRNADLQATISEVRPDGKETFVQGGWLRANERKLDRRKSRKLEPVLSLRKRDVKPLPRKRFVKVTIPLYYQGHAYRSGSRIRVTLSAPNGDQPIWAFGETSPAKRAKIEIARSKQRPSNLLLPVVAVPVSTGLPPCPGLRGEPCRDYRRYKNRAVKKKH